MSDDKQLSTWLRQRQKSDEDQLVEIGAFLGGDARDVETGDKSIAGLVKQEVGKLRAIAAAVVEWDEAFRGTMGYGGSDSIAYDERWEEAEAVLHGLARIAREALK